MAEAAEMDALLRERIRVMDDDRFEQLVFELAKLDDPPVQRLATPDAGADTVRLADKKRKARVWQAKHYPNDIKWAECEKSLDDAAMNWEPDRVTFAFPRDLSAPLETRFKTDLIDGQPDITIDKWTLSELVSRLGQHPKLRRRFFGPDQEEITEKLERAAGAGGPVERGSDLVKRASTLGEFAAEEDPDFSLGVSTGGVDVPAPNYEQLPYVSVELIGKSEKTRLDAWVREGATVPEPAFSFLDDEAGAATRHQVVKALARGEAVAFGTDGVSFRLQLPRAVEEVVRGTGALEGGTFRLSPSEPLDVEVELRPAEGETLTRHVPMRAVPPSPGAAFAFAGVFDGLTFTLDFALPGPPRVELRLNFSASFGRSAGENAPAARALRAIAGGGAITLRNPTLFPERQVNGELPEHENGDAVVEMTWRQEFYEDVVFVEDQLGVEIALPDDLPTHDMNVIGTVVDMLRTDEGTATFNPIHGIANTPADIPYLPERLRGEGVHRQEVIHSAFGQELNLGMGEYEIPELEIVGVTALGSTPDAPASVRLTAKDSDQVRVRLVGRASASRGS